MARVRKSTICKNVCLSVAIALAVTAFCMIFAVMVEHVKFDLYTYRGYEIAMKSHRFISGEYVQKMEFSFFNFTAYMLLLLGIVASFAGIANRKQGLVLAVLTMLLFVGAGVLFLCQPGNMQPYIAGAESMSKEQVNKEINNIRENYQLAIGGVIAAVCSFLAAAFALLSKITWQIAHEKE